jgi:hypothetical protein
LPWHSHALDCALCFVCHPEPAEAGGGTDGPVGHALDAARRAKPLHLQGALGLELLSKREENEVRLISEGLTCFSWDTSAADRQEVLCDNRGFRFVGPV